MKRIQKGPVRGISLKVQEEERERKLDYIPETSIVDTSKIEIDHTTAELVKQLDLGDLPNIKVSDKFS